MGWMTRKRWRCLQVSSRLLHLWLVTDAISVRPYLSATGFAVDNEGIACKFVAGAKINTVQLTCGPLFNENLERALSASMCLWGYL